MDIQEQIEIVENFLAVLEPLQEREGVFTAEIEGGEAFLKHLQEKVKNLLIHDVTSTFECFHCKGVFNRTGSPCLHYDDNVNNDDIVSLCNKCVSEAMNDAKQKGLENMPDRFFNCR